MSFSPSTGLNPISVDASSDRIYTGSLELPDGTAGFFILNDGTLRLVDPRKPNPVTTLYESGHIGWPAIVDFDRDGSLDFIFADYTLNHLVGVNANGGLLEHFPFTFEEGILLSGTPLVTDLENDGNSDLVIPTNDSLSVNIQIMDNTLQPKPYSPLYVGGITQNNAMPLNPVIFGSHLFAFSHQGDLKGWLFEDMGDTEWGYKYGSHPYNKVTGQLGNVNIPPKEFSVLNPDETYNWPNPADLNTHIRFEVAEPGGSVDIKVINLSGRVIYEKQVETTGGFPEEIPVQTRHWGNGSYFALVKATVNGQTETKLIKIGVVH